MIGIARVDATRDIDRLPEFGGPITVPDINLPADVEWGAERLGELETVIYFNGHATLWHGPHVVGPAKFYVIDAPKKLLAKLRQQLGAGNVAPLIKALRAKPALRAWAKTAGFKLVRNSAGKPVTIIPPMVICGTKPIDLDGDELDDAEELPDLE